MQFALVGVFVSEILDVGVSHRESHRQRGEGDRARGGRFIGGLEEHEVGIGRRRGERRIRRAHDGREVVRRAAGAGDRERRTGDGADTARTGAREWRVANLRRDGSRPIVRDGKGEGERAGKQDVLFARLRRQQADGALAGF